MKLELAQTWDDVQRAASAANTCIAAPGLGNHDNAREDWEQHPGQVEYWLNEERTEYARIIRVAESYPLKVVWLLDYAKPFTADHVQRLSAVLFGTLMVAYPPSGMNTDTQILLPAIERPTWLKYVARSLHSGEWVFVACQGEKLESRQLTPVIETVFDD